MDIIAEIGMAHDGSLSMAHAYLDAAADAGADSVKFQCHIAAEESTQDEPWRVEPTWTQDRNRYSYWKRTEFSATEWAGLRSHAVGRRVEFLCSPFSVKAVEILEPLVERWKIPSGEILNEPLMRAVAATEKDVIVSTGMCTWDELDTAWGRRASDWTFLQCTTRYPTLPREVGLGVMEQLRNRYDASVGLSDHSGTIFPGLAACALGADVLEVHVCWHKHQGGFDTPASITMEDLAELVRGVEVIDESLKPVDKDLMAVALTPIRELFMEKWKRKVGGK